LAKVVKGKGKNKVSRTNAIALGMIGKWLIHQLREVAEQFGTANCYDLKIAAQFFQ
jgi:hypothetical protein